MKSLKIQQIIRKEITIKNHDELKEFLYFNIDEYEIDINGNLVGKDVMIHLFKKDNIDTILIYQKFYTSCVKQDKKYNTHCSDYYTVYKTYRVIYIEFLIKNLDLQ
jgi:hypothetical protein